MPTQHFETIKIDVTPEGACTLLLNRPKVHNAFDEFMIEDITNALQQLRADEAVRVLCIKGAGASFCAGANLNWMKRTAEYAQEENYRDALRMANMMYSLYSFPKPTVAVVHGAVYGGGVGLIACCDIVLAESSTVFSLSEVKLGLIPAVIGPYVVNAMGTRSAKRYILTGERFDASAACRSGLVQESTDAELLAESEAEIMRELLSCGPNAQKVAKSLVIEKFSPSMGEEIQKHTAGLISKIRASEEGKEGVGAFLDKRSPAWRKY
ncbi:MAG: hypothetical protein F4Z97_01040 [Gammaproteobacteria bacterium]|nr:hypothetical protein [Gammaproteobacteria bacterium]